MRDDSTSVWTELLLAMRGPLFEMNRSSPLMEMLRRENAEKKRIDDEWLASLSERERQIELTRRRIAALEARYRNWWETNMAWRFRPDPPDFGDGW